MRIMKICGLDEAGRGPLAGPLVAAAVALNPKIKISNLKDSKKLNKLQRERAYKEIINSGAEVAVEIISARQINNQGIGWANKEIFRRLIKKIEAKKYIVDGNLKLGRIKNSRVKCVIGADRTRKCVMAASIVAKVTRDRLMLQLHKEHPQYGWKINMGYGTSHHVEAIREHGMVKYHRSVFVTTVLRKTIDRFA
ncbi:hypothetical protein A3H89_05545 [Candidatus Amesbacteria bacterium RIFCSPLOWO2_02_FULL_48_11]|uniref:Ribonuclease n=5 Tax=Candidatus Amesiibacteriota TaxID=1752730 RepID=A0A1F4Z9Q6_9BACT|nr:MAG: hypothetical protein A3E17_04630 [Candidatus Amesbacteria bacterium RIFCSPHIGHO2_12_FULL_48_14]OGD06678.1 MAG: hypothetical protein A3H89_05545 [Candidatus Amesbacteria bacterium RIFCSPLOWO2_02_FULL_48_11]OGD11403.1 MAG: hypothetical protein A2576_02095 [Candidatus Amesbacteria bacterium RIFOXYD1_FULL_47_9]